MAAVAKALLCIFSGLAAVYLGCRAAGRSWDWVGAHLLPLVVAAYAVALATGYASEKPDPGPSPAPKFDGRWRQPMRRINVGTNDAFRTLMPTYVDGERVE